MRTSPGPSEDLPQPLRRRGEPNGDINFAREIANESSEGRIENNGIISEKQHTKNRLIREITT